MADFKFTEEEMEHILPPKIENFNELIEPHLDGARVLSHTSRFLTKPGDNYGSTMLGVTVKTEKPNGDIEELEVVAKLPPTNEQCWEVFRPQETFPRENHCYTNVAYQLRKLQIERGVLEEDIFDTLPKCYGARISLDSNAIEADKNAVLLLENLITKGYKVADRVAGFDLDHAFIVLKGLAQFHALPIALRVLKPKVFEAEFRKKFSRFNVEDGIDKEMDQRMKQACLRDVRTIPEVTDEIYEKLKNLVPICEKYMANKEECKDMPFTTLVHFDFWVNNMLIKYNASGDPVKIKIVDFQIAQLESLVHDLIFFLFSSVQSEVLINSLDELLKYYYDCFVKNLRDTGCNVAEYSYEKFMEEVNKLAAYQVIHVMLMLKVLYMRKDVMATFDEVKPDLFTNPDNLEPQFFEKSKNVLLIMHERGWLNPQKL